MEQAASWLVKGDETDRNVVKRSRKFRVGSWQRANAIRWSEGSGSWTQ